MKPTRLVRAAILLCAASALAQEEPSSEHARKTLEIYRSVRRLEQLTPGSGGPTLVLVYGAGRAVAAVFGPGRKVRTPQGSVLANGQRG